MKVAVVWIRPSRSRSPRRPGWGAVCAKEEERTGGKTGGTRQRVRLGQQAKG